MFGCTGLVGQQNRASAVVDTTGVACRDCAVGAHHAFELGQGFQTGFAWVLILVHHHSIAFFLQDGDGRDFLRQETSFLCGNRLHLTGQSHAVLGVALDFEVGSHVLRGFGHGIHTEHAFHQRVDETPADGGVINLRVAAKCRFSFGHHKRCAAHAFHATGDHQTSLTSANGTGGGAQSVHARTA